MRNNNFIKSIHLGKPSLFADNSSSKEDSALLIITPNYTDLEHSVAFMDENSNAGIILPAISM